MTREPRFIRSIQSQANRKNQLSLDIGSTATRVAINDKIVFDEPTCIALQRGSDSVVAVGKKAYQLLGKNSRAIEVIFPIQYAAVASRRHFLAFLQAIKQQLKLESSVWSQLAGNQVFLAIPDTLSPIEKALYIDVVKQAHFGKVSTRSASLAALHNLNRADANVPTCLIHLGGQTTQMVVVSAGEVINPMRFQLGGLLFTEAVQEQIRTSEQCSVGWHLAEAVKKEIGFVDSPVMTRTIRQKKMSVQGKDISTQLGKTVAVSAEVCSKHFPLLVDDLVMAIQLFFSQLPTELASAAVSEGIVLTGGTSQLTGLSEYLSSKLQSEVFVSPTSEKDVVTGVRSVTQGI